MTTFGRHGIVSIATTSMMKRLRSNIAVETNGDSHVQFSRSCSVFNEEGLLFQNFRGRERVPSERTNATVIG